MGLFDSVTSSIGGLLGDPRVKDSLMMSLAAGVGPDSDKRMQMMFNARMEQQEAEKRRALEDLQRRIYEGQIKKEEDLQGRQDITAAMMQAMSSQTAEAVNRLRGALQSGDEAGAQKAREDLQRLQSPENQLLLRSHIAGHGDMDMALQGGLVAPMQQEENTAKMREYEFARQNGYTGSFIDYLQLGAGGQASLFAPTLVRGEDGKYRAVQFGNTPGMLPVISELGGVPSFDPGIAGQRAEATAIGTASGEATAAAPGEVAILEDAIALFSRLSEMPGLEAATGPVQGRLPTVNKATADFEALRKQAISTIALAARGQLKGTGPITDSEQAQLNAAQTLLADPTISETLARQEISRVLQWLESKKARKEQMIVPGSSSAQQPTSSAPRRRGVFNPQTGRIEYQ